MPFFGYVSLREQPINWISRHESFASEAWVIGKVKWGPEPWQWRGNGRFIIVTQGNEGNKVIKVEFQVQGYWSGRNRMPSHVEVCHIHAF